MNKPQSEDYFRIIADALIRKGIVTKEEIFYSISNNVEIDSIELDDFLKSLIK